MKSQKFKIVIFMILLTVVSTLPIFLIDKLPYGGDLNFHLKRIEAITTNLRHGLIHYPIYFKYLNNYGYASGLFYPDLFLYIPAFLNIFGFSLFTSYKIFLFIIKLLSLVSIYFSVKAVNKNKFSGIIAVVLYAFSSYCFIDMFERGALAETLTIIFVPLIIRGIYEVFYGDIKKYYFLPLGVLGILYSHVISLYLISIFIAIFLLFHIRYLDIFKIKVLIKSFLIVILVGSNFIFPLMEQMWSGKFYFNNIANTNIVKYNTVPFLFLFFECPYYIFMGNYMNRWMPSGIGIVYLYLCYYCVKHRKEIDNISKKFLYGGLICLLFACDTFLWNITFVNRIFSLIQFPFRIYILATNLFIFSFSRIFSKLENRLLVKKILIIFIIMFSFNLFYPFINIKTSKLTDDEILYGEYLPLEYPGIEYHMERVDKIISNCDMTYNIDYNVKTRIEFESKCDSLIFEIPIIYYKGYRVTINDKDVEVSKSNNGLINITTNVSKGIIEVSYKGTNIYNITKYISLGVVIMIVLKKAWDVIYEKKCKS